MRIKKTSQTTTLPAQVVNTYNDSTEDAYSCDYVNKTIEPNIITVNIPDINPISFTAYENQNITSGYSLNSSVGSKLTLNNGVVIGTGVSKVKIDIMAKFYNGDADNNVYMIFINKNGAGQNNTYSVIRAYDFGTETLPSYLLDVQEGDVITLGISCSKTITNISRLFTGYLTVEVIK